MIKVTVDVNKAVNGLMDLDRRAKKREVDALRYTGRTIVKRAQQILQSFGYYDLGKADSSFKIHVYSGGDSFQLVVENIAYHYQWLEEGSEKHWVTLRRGDGFPRQSLIDWAMRHGIIYDDGKQYRASYNNKPIRALYVGLEDTHALSTAADDSLAEFVERSGRIYE